MFIVHVIETITNMTQVLFGVKPELAYAMFGFYTAIVGQISLGYLKYKLSDMRNKEKD